MDGRLDNVVYKLGFAPSRASARTTVVHGHIHVNGRWVNIPSYSVRVGDKITIKDAEKPKSWFVANRRVGEPHVQNWLKLDRSTEADVLALPTRDDVMMPVEEQLIVEMCSQ